MALTDHNPELSDHSTGQSKRSRETLASPTSTTNLWQKRERHEVIHGYQRDKTKKMTAGKITPTSYAGAVKAGN